MQAVGSVNIGGVTVSEEEFKKNNKRMGNCESCGNVKTHKRKLLNFYPITEEPEVYMGYCLMCNNIKDVRKFPNVITAESRKKCPEWVEKLSNARKIKSVRKKNSRMKAAVAAIAATSNFAEVDEDRKERGMRCHSVKFDKKPVVKPQLRATKSEVAYNSNTGSEGMEEEEVDDDDDFFIDSSSSQHRRTPSDGSISTRGSNPPVHNPVSPVRDTSARSRKIAEAYGSYEARNSSTVSNESTNRRSRLPLGTQDSFIDDENEFLSEESKANETNPNAEIDGTSGIDGEAHLESFLSSMKSTQSNIFVQLQSLNHLISIYSFATACDLTGMEDQLTSTIDCTVSCMAAHPHDADICMLGCQMLRIISTSGLVTQGPPVVNTEACGLLILLEAVEAVVTALTSVTGKQSTSFQLTSDALRVLKNILRSHRTAKDKIINAANFSGMERIVGGMLEHSGSASIQEDGCILIWSLCFNDSSNQICVDRCNGIMAIILAMMGHSDVAAVQENACGALHTMSFNLSIKTTIVDNGGVQCCVQAMQNHPTKRLLLERACTALISLVMNSNQPENPVVMSREGINALVNILLSNTLGAKLHLYAAHVLSILVQGQANALLLCDVGMSNELMNALNSVAQSSKENSERVRLIILAFSGGQ